MKDIDDLKGFIETIYEWDTPGLQPLCMVHTIWYLLRCPPQEVTIKDEEGTSKLLYMLPSFRDMIYESIKSMFTEKEQPIPALTSYAFERGLENLHPNVVGYAEKKSKTGATMVLPPQAQNPDVKLYSDTGNQENLCWIQFNEYDKAKVDDLINYCANDLRDACEGAEIYSWNELKGEKNEVDEFFDKLDPNDVNKLKIMRMIERTEVMLRRLLVAKYEKHAGWTEKKKYVPDGIISKMYKKPVGNFRCLIDKRFDDALAFSGKIRVLSPVQAFVNACTLGEEIEIIKYRKQNFTEKKNKETKELEGGPFKEKELQRIIDNFEELKNIRDRRSHFDEQLTWDDKMVERVRVLTDAIIEPIVNYFNK